jgi:DNA repair photolyase
VWRPAKSEHGSVKNRIVNVPTLQDPIKASPGFLKKGLSDFKLDLMGLCGFGCVYCSSNEGNYLRIQRKKFLDLTEEQLGERVLPSEDPSLTFVWPDVLANLKSQLDRKGDGWGEDQTLVFSMLTDAFSPVALKDGTTEAALRMLLERTRFRIRVLTKSAAVGSPKWIRFFKSYPGRFIVGLSIGSLDDEWARRIEVGTSPPSARLKALTRLQEAGVPTFGMACPIFPDELEAGALDDLIGRMRPDLVEDFWAEPFNDRVNWRVVRDGYAPSSAGHGWLTDVYENRNLARWSEYATELYERLLARAREGGWVHKLRYLLYEEKIVERDAPRFAGFEGVMLQSKPAADGRSSNPFVARLQQATGATASLPGTADPQERPRRRLPVLTEPLSSPRAPGEPAAQEHQLEHRRRRREQQADGAQRGGRDADGAPRLAAAEHRQKKEPSMKKPARKRDRKAKPVARGKRRSQRVDVIIDKEIAVLIPSLSPEELARLERSILAEGCREPLTAWDDGHRKILLDGHNRLRICRRHRVPYTIRCMKFADRDEAIRWVTEHQLGRRNLTPEAYAFLRGRLYNGMKRQGSRSDLTSGHSAQKSTTAQQIAAKYKVDEKTIRRDGRFAEQLDALADAVGANVKDEVLTRGARISRADVPRLLQVDEQTRRRVVAEVRQGARASTLLRVARAGTDEHMHEEPDHAPHGLDHARWNGTVDDTLEQLALVERALRDTSPGSLSEELIARTSELLKALDAALAPHRRAQVPRQTRPCANIAGAVEAAVELQKIVIADKVQEIAGLGPEELREGEVLVEALAEMERAMMRLSLPDGRRRRGAPRRPVTVPAFMKELQPIIPPNSTLAERHGDVLRVFEVFNLARKYLSKIEPAIELAHGHYAMMHTDNSPSAAIFDAIARFIEHGSAFVAGRSTFRDHLEAHGVPWASFQDAEAALVQEVRAGTRAAFASLSERWKRPPNLAQDTPIASSSLQWPITAALSEPAFNELREIVRDGIAGMERGSQTLAQIYQGRVMPPGAERIRQDAIDTALRCRPLIDGTFTHADHLRAWGADSSSQLGGRTAEATTQTSAKALPNAAVAPASGATAFVPEKPTTSQWAEYEQLCRGYLGAMVPPEGVLAEIEQKDWPEDLKERARSRITTGWKNATTLFPAPPRAER